MGSVDCLIDTNPLAASVDGVSSRLNATTAAVVAMQAAVIKAEQDAADTITRNVDRGFLALMQSQLMTKKAQYYSDMNATMGLLVELAKSLDAKEERMQDDVARLHRQYYKIFHSIDLDLKNRLLQLNREAMNLAENRKELITTRMLRDTTTALCTEQESSQTTQLAVTARLKSKTSKALENVGQDIVENEDYKQQLQDLLEERSMQQAQAENIPVLLVKEDSMVVQGNVVSRVIIPEQVGGASRAAIENTMMTHMDALTSVRKTDFERNEIWREFGNLMSSANLNPRVANVMMQLFQAGEKR